MTTPRGHSGRELPDPGFAGDDGAGPPALLAALAAHATDPARLPEVVAALYTCRVLAPVVATAGEVHAMASGLRAEKSADIAVPVLVRPDGARALPVFSSLESLVRWSAEARPVPVPGLRAAQVALAEQAEALVLDIAGPTSVTLLLPDVRALAEGRGRTPAWLDPALAAEVGQVLDSEPSARSAHLDPRAGWDARLTVIADPALDAEELTGLGRRFTEVVADLDAVRRGVRGLEVTVVTRGGRPARG